MSKYYFSMNQMPPFMENKSYARQGTDCGQCNKSNVSFLLKFWLLIKLAKKKIKYKYMQSNVYSGNIFSNITYIYS